MNAVVNAVSERRLDLFGRDQVLIRGAVEQDLDPLGAGAELTHAIHEPLRIPDRRNVRIGDQEDRVRGVKRRHDERVDGVAGVDHDLVVGPAEHAEELFDRAGVLRIRPIELLGPGQDVETRLVLRHELLEELLVELVQALDRVEHGEARPDAEEQRDLAEARLQIEDDRRPLRQPRELDGAVHRNGRRAGAAFGAKKHVGGAGLARAGVGRFAPRRGLPDRAVEGLFHRAAGLCLPARRPRKELVGAGAHRAENQVGFGRHGDGEDRHRRVGRAEPFDCRHARGRIRAEIDHRDVWVRAVRRATVDDPDRDPTRPQQRGCLAFEFVIMADDERC